MDFGDLLFFILLFAFSLLPKKKKETLPDKKLIPDLDEVDTPDLDQVRKKIEALRKKRQTLDTGVPSIEAGPHASTGKEVETCKVPHTSHSTPSLFPTTKKSKIHPKMTPIETFTPTTPRSSSKAEVSMPAPFPLPSSSPVAPASPDSSLGTPISLLSISTGTKQSQRRLLSYSSSHSRLKTWMIGHVILEQPRFKKASYGNILGR